MACPARCCVHLVLSDSTYQSKKHPLQMCGPPALPWPSCPWSGGAEWWEDVSPEPLGPALGASRCPVSAHVLAVGCDSESTGSAWPRVWPTATVRGLLSRRGHGARRREVAVREGPCVRRAFRRSRWEGGGDRRADSPLQGLAVGDASPSLVLKITDFHSQRPPVGLDVRSSL